MTRKTRIKSDAVEHWVPGDRDQVNEAIAEIGRLQRERDRIQADMNDRIAAIKADHDENAKPHAERIRELAKGVQLWCEANRAALTKDGKVKFHEFATGIVKWRRTPWSVSISKVADVIALLKAKGLGDAYVRNTETVNKEALLESRELIQENPIKGISFKQREEIAIVPHESKIEEVQS